MKNLNLNKEISPSRLGQNSQCETAVKKSLICVNLINLGIIYKIMLEEKYTNSCIWNRKANIFF